MSPQRIASTIRRDVPLLRHDAPLSEAFFRALARRLADRT